MVGEKRCEVEEANEEYEKKKVMKRWAGRRWIGLLVKGNVGVASFRCTMAGRTAVGSRSQADPTDLAQDEE